MQLTFHDQSFQTSAISVDAIATFMGCPYARKQFTVAQRQQLEELTYRSIHYTR